MQDKVYLPKSVVVTIFIVSLSIAVIKNLAPSWIIGSWDIITYILLLLPLLQMIYTKNIRNIYTKWLIFPILILVFDIFYYNNYLARNVLPFIVYGAIFTLYSGSMQNMKQFFQVFIPKLSNSFTIFSSMEYLLTPFNSIKENLKNNSFFSRIAIALIVTAPVFGLFLALFMSSSSEFSLFIEGLFHFKNPFELHHLLTIPLLFFIIVSIFDFSLSNTKARNIKLNTKPFDPLIVSIFLGALNLLFITFVSFQISYLFGGENYISQRSGLSIAQYARKGFFELSFVLSIVVVIFLVIIYRFKEEKFIAILMSGLILESIIVGLSSLQKIYLYQELMGATVLRYYVEWFDYFIIIVLLLGIVFLFLKKAFYQILNLIVILATISFTVVASINVEAMVASYNLKKFSKNSKKLDKKMLSHLSVDALEQLKGSGIKLKSKKNGTKGGYIPRDCTKFSQYHLGYCMRVSKYGL